MIGYADPSLKVEMGVHHGVVSPWAANCHTLGPARFELDGQPAWSLLMESSACLKNSPPVAMSR